MSPKFQFSLLYLIAFLVTIYNWKYSNNNIFLPQIKFNSSSNSNSSEIVHEINLSEVLNSDISNNQNSTLKFKIELEQLGNQSKVVSKVISNPSNSTPPRVDEARGLEPPPHVNSPRGIIVKPGGGLGNQLFRYACSFALAKKLQLPLYVLDDEFNKKNNKKKQKNNKNSIERDSSLESTLSRKAVLDKFHIPLNRFIPNPRNQTDFYYFNDEQLFYNKLTLNSSELKNKYLVHNDGCQSESYFKDYKDQIKKDLEPEITQSEGKSDTANKWESRLEDVNQNVTFVSVGIHVRLGDYLTGICKNQHWVTPMSYYRTAMDLMQKKYPGKRLKFFVFSDSIDYVRDNLIPKQNNGTKTTKDPNDKTIDWDEEDIYYVSSTSTSGPSSKDNKGEDERRMTNLEEFNLMLLCRNMIVSNSTFSWWGAYLNKNKDKIIIGPLFDPRFFDKYQPESNRKFRKLLMGETYRYPPEWIVLNPYL